MNILCEPPRGQVGGRLERGWIEVETSKTPAYSTGVQNDSLPEDAVRRQLDRVLSSGGFARNDRLSQFLRFVVERHLEGRDGELKESVLGVEVFGRQPGFDPKVDGIVRTEAIRLRARLDKYYASEGHADPMIIAVPKGGYRPVIRERAVPHEAATGRTRPSWKVGLVVTAALLLAAIAGVTWWSGRRAVRVARYEANAEAYDLYLRGREQMATFPSQNRPIAPTAIGYYEQAIARDPSYAPAYAGMADTYLAVEKNIGTAPMLSPDLLAQAKTAAARALELDPMLSEAHVSMGSILAREYAWQDAERHFRRAIELDQNNALAHLGLGFEVLLMQGRVDEAIAEARLAVRLDPLSAHTNTEYGRALFWARRYNAAVDQLRIAIALDPGRARPYGVLARALFAEGRTGDAMNVFDQAVQRGAMLPGSVNIDLACVAARSGRRDDQVVAMLQGQFTHRSANFAARAYACVGKAPEATQHLDRAFAARQANLAEILQDPYVAWMQADEQFATFRRQLNLPDRSVSSQAH